MKTSVHLRFRDSRPDISPQAVLLSGANLEQLLNEVCTWSVSTEDLRVVLLSSGRSREGVELFVVFPEGISRKPGERGHPYFDIGAGFYIPLEAQLWPPLSPDEIKALQVYRLCVFHPVEGMYGIEAQELLSVSDLLRRPSLVDGGWTGICSEDEASNRHIRSVRLETPLLLEEVFGEESRDIGSEPISNLASKPLEVAKAAPSLLFQKVFALIAGFIVRLTALVPRSVHVSPTWINALENWAQRKFSGLMQEIDKARNSEIERLLTLLKENPEEGLKHAISLAELAERGKAQASARLGRRSLDFDLRRLGGGAARDNWDVSASSRLNLVRLYRENAQREMQLGRHRRAAYIFAELLGDLSSAADALKQGRFFREAALLYKERLNRPLVAAEILAQGGLLLEAIDIYVQQQSWLEVAPLFEKLGQAKEAEDAYRKAIQGYVDRGDVVSAARIVDRNLLRPDESIALLASTWPGGKQAMECLENRVEILIREARVRDVSVLLEELTHARVSQNRITGVISLAAKVAQSNVDLGIRALARELVVQKSSIALSEAGFSSSEELKVLKALTSIAPNDRLLSRDASRFRTSRRGIQVQKRLPATSGLLKSIAVSKSRSFTFPKVQGWFKVVATKNGMAAIARSRIGKYFVTRGTWSGAQQSVEFPIPVGEHSSAYFSAQDNHIIVGTPFSLGLPTKEMESTDLFGGHKMTVGTPDWLFQDVVEVAHGRSSVWAVRLVSGHPVLCSFVEGKQVYSRDVTAEIAEAQDADEGVGVYLDGLGGRKSVAMAYGRSVLVKTDQNALYVRKFDQMITGLSHGHPALAGWVVHHEKGASYLSEDALVISSLDETLDRPHVVSLGDGRLVLVSSNSGMVFHAVDGGMKPAGIFKIPESENAVIGVVATDTSDEFAVAYTNGLFQCFRLGY